MDLRLVVAALGACALFFPCGLRADVTRTVSTADELIAAVDEANAATETTIINLAAGEYTISAAITLNASITLRGADGTAKEDVVLKSDGVDHRVIAIKNAGAIVSGLTLDGYGEKKTFTGHGAVVNISSGGGTVTNCIIRNGYCKNPGTSGGGIYMTAPGLVTHCVITNNATGSARDIYGGSAVFMNHANAVVRNCLIASNKTEAGYGPDIGAGYAAVHIYQNGGVLENCTVARNYSIGKWTSGVGVYGTSKAVVRNCIIAENTNATTGTSDEYEANWIASANGVAAFKNCACPDFINANCAVVAAPFDATASNPYLPRMGTAAINNATTETWMTDAIDLAGEKRILNGAPDIGAYEADVSEAGLFASFYGDAVSGLAGLTVNFQATVVNATEGDIVYEWFVDGELKATKTNEATFEYVFESAANARVALRVTNGNVSYPADMAQAETFSVRVLPVVFYVAPAESGSSNEFPYDTPSRAAHDLSTVLALALDGCDIVVSNGVYAIEKNYEIDKDIGIYGFPGSRKEDVIFKHSRNAQHRLFTLKHAKAVLSGLTLDGDGYDIGNIDGVLVYMGKGGMVTNCILRNGYSTGQGNHGGGIYLGSDGMVSHCVISNNVMKYGRTSYSGSAVSLNHNSATLRNCLIVKNKTKNRLYDTDTGAGLAAVLIMDNGGIVESCTIADNEAAEGWPAGVGIYKEPKAVVRNCIIARNRNATTGTMDETQANWGGASATYFVNCVSDSEINTDGNCHVVNNPFDEESPNGYYPLDTALKIVNNAVQQDWMASATDLDGNDRIRDGAPDVGCYEIEGLVKNQVVVDFAVDGEMAGLAPFRVTLVANVQNAGDAEIVYYWDLDGDGEYDDKETTDATLEWEFASPISANVGLQVAVDGTIHTSETVFNLTAVPRTLYVAPENATSLNQAPYDTPEKAAWDVKDAFRHAAVDGCEIVFLKGDHAVAIGAGESMEINKKLTVRGETGNPAETTLTLTDDSARRFFTLNHAESVISSLTLDGNHVSSLPQYENGALLYVRTNGGTVTNCVLRNGFAGYACGGGAVRIEGGLITHCILSNNCVNVRSGNAEYGHGSAVAMAVAKGGNARLEHCLLVGNKTVEATTTDNRSGGTVSIHGAGASTVLNCTIASNSAYQCSGVYVIGANAKVINTIIADNVTTAGEPHETVYALTQDSTTSPLATFSNCLTDALSDETAASAWMTTGNFINDPGFKNPAKGNWRLKLQSFAVNKGVMKDANGNAYAFPSIDLDGNPRVKGRAIDMGCYEQCGGGMAIIMR